MGPGGRLPNLTDLLIRGTDLKGSLPAGLNLPSLRWMDLAIRQNPDFSCPQHGGGFTGKTALTFWAMHIVCKSCKHFVCHGKHLPQIPIQAACLRTFQQVSLLRVTVGC